MAMAFIHQEHTDNHADLKKSVAHLRSCNITFFNKSDAA